MVGRTERGGRQGKEQKQQQQHAFSIELKSKDHLKSISLGNENNNHVVIEGLLGKLLDLKLIEDSMLQVRGANGTLRLDVSGKEIRMRLKEERGKVKEEGGV
jgi:hypothetical protein